ncbi:hypothetical protein, partial [Vreelandella nigrificans]|uniref:hypothetical protein n=1 Tax=Vreelandella nigrificans TaxID=2042704 RepID=UPI001AD8399C
YPSFTAVSIVGASHKRRPFRAPLVFMAGINCQNKGDQSTRSRHFAVFTQKNAKKSCSQAFGELCRLNGTVIVNSST